MTTFLHSNLPFADRQPVPDDAVHVYIDNCQLYTLPVFNSFIVTLNCSFNEICDIQTLKNYKCLTHLLIQKIEVRDFSVLTQLRQLITLNLSDNVISDLSCLAKCTLLQDLQLNNCMLRSADPIKGLKQLRFLSLAGNYLENIEFLKQMAQLECCNVAYNNIKQFDMAQIGKKLQLIRMENNPVQCKDVIALIGKKKVQYGGELYIDGDGCEALVKMIGGTVNGFVDRSSRTVVKM